MYERIPSQLKSELQLEDIDSWEVYPQQINSTLDQLGTRLDSRINCRDVLPLSLTYVINPYPPSATRANLITIPRQIMPNIRKQTSEFVVPKFLLTNICSLAKTKNRVRAVVALETDLRRKDIDVCIVSETHLKTNIPNSAVDIHNYDIYRRDRN